MGKYQLDYKGIKQVEKYHEDQSRGIGSSQKDRVKALLRQYQNKK